jgi:hypothetical protein
VTYSTNGAYASRPDNEHNVALGSAVICVFVALFSLVAFFSLPWIAVVVGVGPVMPLIFILSLGLSLGWLFLLVRVVRFFGRRGLWLLLSAPLALCWWWFPHVPGLCGVVSCTYVQFGITII